MSAEPIRFARLVVDLDGVSRFEDAEIAVTPRDFAPPAAPLDVSAAMEATRVVYWRAPPGWDGQRHSAPARQWAIVLQGSLEVETSSGATRRLGPGDGVLLEDVSGDKYITPPLQRHHDHELRFGGSVCGLRGAGVVGAVTSDGTARS